MTVRSELWIACLLALTAGGADDWQRSFPVDKSELRASGVNPYFPLQPGYRLHYANRNETVTATVLAETKMVDGVETRPVEVRETRGGRLVEVTRDYYAVDPASGDVYYFGEDVDIYKDGKVTGHEGAWLSGVKGAKFGLMIPGRPRTGQKFYQELAPGVAMDRAELVSVGEKVTTPAGTFENCLHFNETSPLEKGAADHKWYAPGVGLVKETGLELVKIERAP